MKPSLLQTDPIISTLFKTVTTDYVPTERSNRLLSTTYMKQFLDLLGISKTNTNKIINELVKDLKFLESLNRRIRRLERSGRNFRTADMYLRKLQRQTAMTIAQKILKDDNEINARLLYAKLQVVRKFQERYAAPEVFVLLSESLSRCRNKNIQNDTFVSDKPKAPEYGKVINLTDYIKNVQVH